MSPSALCVLHYLFPDCFWMVELDLHSACSCFINGEQKMPLSTP